MKKISVMLWAILVALPGCFIVEADNMVSEPMAVTTQLAEPYSPLNQNTLTKQKAASSWQHIDLTGLCEGIKEYNLLDASEENILFSARYQERAGLLGNHYLADELLLYELKTGKVKKTIDLDNQSVAEAVVFGDWVYYAACGPEAYNQTYHIYKAPIDGSRKPEMLLGPITANSVFTSPNFEHMGKDVLLRMGDANGTFSGVYLIENGKLEKTLSVDELYLDQFADLPNSMMGNGERFALFMVGKEGTFIALVNQTEVIAKHDVRDDRGVTAFGPDQYGLWVSETSEKWLGKTSEQTGYLTYIRPEKTSEWEIGEEFYRFSGDNHGIFAKSPRLGSIYLTSDAAGRIYQFAIDRSQDGTETHDSVFFCKRISERKYAAQLTDMPLYLSVFSW